MIQEEQLHQNLKYTDFIIKKSVMPAVDKKDELKENKYQNRSKFISTDEYKTGIQIIL